MKHNYTLKLIGVPLFLCLAFSDSRASIEPLSLEKMLEYADGCVVGKITSRKGFLKKTDSLGTIVFTRLTIEGREITSGEKTKVDVWYLGGTANGVSMQVSNQPPDRETTPGTRVVVFYYFEKAFGCNIMVAQLGGIFRIQKGRAGDVVIGKGPGAAIPRNILLSALERDIHSVLAREKGPRENKKRVKKEGK